jgi:hypothetical protein
MKRRLKVFSRKFLASVSGDTDEQGSWAADIILTLSFYRLYPVLKQEGYLRYDNVVITVIFRIAFYNVKRFEPKREKKGSTQR